MHASISFLAIMALLATTTLAGSATFSNYADSACTQYQETTTVRSNHGYCHRQDVNAHVLVTKETCPVTVYTDGNCSYNGNSANVGSCWTGIGSLSIDCWEAYFKNVP